MDFAAARRRANSSIVRNGRTAVLLVSSAADEDADEPWRASGVAQEEVPVRIVVTGFSKTEFGEVQAGDKRVLISAQDLDEVPSPSMELKIGDDVHQIVRVDPVSPSGLDVVYEAWVRARG